MICIWTNPKDGMYSSWANPKDIGRLSTRCDMAVRKTSLSSSPMGYRSSFAKGDNVTLFIFTFVGGEI